MYSLLKKIPLREGEGALEVPFSWEIYIPGVQDRLKPAQNVVVGGFDG